jgi:hypothetical protein
MLRSFASLVRATLLASLLAPLAGCSGESVAPPTPCTLPEKPAGLPLLGSDCDPLVPTQCGFPFPSNVYLDDDPTTPTKKRVHFGATTLPTNVNTALHIDPAVFADSDGFSSGQTILTHMPGATITGLPTQDTIDASLTDASPTLLIEADTGTRVPHFSEIDQSLYTEDDVERSLMIRPVVRLKDATRYIVAIRHIVDKDGKLLAPTPAFQALRDGTELCEASVVKRRDLYKDIFAKLEAAKIPTKDLQIAWDYTTASRENNTARFLHMRDDALAKVGALGPEYTIDVANVEENPNPHIRRRILGKMKVPLYLDQPGPGGHLMLDQSGMPMQNGTAEFEFLVHVPNAATLGTPGAIVQNGHGLLGSKTEGQNGYLAEFCDKWNYVGVSVDLIGMANDDVNAILNSIVADVGGFKNEVDRQHQGILNSLLAMRLMKGRFVNEPLVQFNGKSAIDPTLSFYRGDSQGGIFGTTYMSVSTDVTRGLLGEPGAPYSMLLTRSVDFAPYFVLLKSAYGTGRSLQIIIGLLQMLWDRTEPNGYMPYLAQNPLPGTPAHNVLLHVAVGDYQVTPLGAHIIARAVGAKNLSPVNRSIWGIPEDPGPFTGSGMVEFDFGLPEAPKTDTPPEGDPNDDPHDKVRVLPQAMDQTHEFFRTGTIKAFCTGSCDPQ